MSNKKAILNKTIAEKIASSYQYLIGVHLEMLYSKFGIKNNNRILLLNKLLTDFSDENCFEKLKSF